MNKTISIPEEKHQAVIKYLLLGENTPLNYQEKIELYDSVHTEKKELEVLVSFTSTPIHGEKTQQRVTHYKKHKKIKEPEDSKKEPHKHKRRLGDKTKNNMNKKMQKVVEYMHKHKDQTINQAMRELFNQNMNNYYKAKFIEYCKSQDLNEVYYLERKAIRKYKKAEDKPEPEKEVTKKEQERLILDEFPIEKKVKCSSCGKHDIYRGYKGDLDEEHFLCRTCKGEPVDEPDESEE